MINENIIPISEAGLYAGFDNLTRSLLTFWRNRIVKVGLHDKTGATTADINQRLLSDNAVIFFDHHYAFDALPVAFVLGRVLKRVTQVLVPYAVHLDMGVDPEGLPSLRYKLRTRAFQWLINNIKKTNSNIHVLAVAREFELNNPRLKAIVDRRFPGTNTKYVKRFTRMFSTQKKGLICLLSPTAGIAFPEKPGLHPQVYRLMDMVQSKREKPLAFYFVSAYPKLQAYHNYAAPLLTRHNFVAQGPFTLPHSNYEQALEIVSNQIQMLRRTAQFSLPDYSKIKHK